jgi:hypothetical protein
MTKIKLYFFEKIYRNISDGMSMKTPLVAFSRIVLVFTISAISLLFASSCGVKGDPLPPVTPAELGRGQPTYKKAFRDIRIESQKDAQDEESSEDERKKKKFE